MVNLPSAIRLANRPTVAPKKKPWLRYSGSMYFMGSSKPMTTSPMLPFLSGVVMLVMVAPMLVIFTVIPLSLARVKRNASLSPTVPTFVCSIFMAFGVKIHCEEKRPPYVAFGVSSGEGPHLYNGEPNIAIFLKRNNTSGQSSDKF